MEKRKFRLELQTAVGNGDHHRRPAVRHWRRLGRHTHLGRDGFREEEGQAQAPGGLGPGRE